MTNSNTCLPTSASRIFAKYADSGLFDQLATIVGREDFDSLFLPVAERLALRIQEMPLTQQAFSSRGAAVQCALRAGLLAVRACDTTIFSPTATAAERMVGDRHYRWLAFCCALATVYLISIANVEVHTEDGEHSFADDMALAEIGVEYAMLWRKRVSARLPELHVFLANFWFPGMFAHLDHDMVCELAAAINPSMDTPPNESPLARVVRTAVERVLLDEVSRQQSQVTSQQAQPIAAAPIPAPAPEPAPEPTPAPAPAPAPVQSPEPPPQPAAPAPTQAAPAPAPIPVTPAPEPAPASPAPAPAPAQRTERKSATEQSRRPEPAKPATPRPALEPAPAPAASAPRPPPQAMPPAATQTRAPSALDGILGIKPQPQNDIQELPPGGSAPKTPAQIKGTEWLSAIASLADYDAEIQLIDDGRIELSRKALGFGAAPSSNYRLLHEAKFVDSKGERSATLTAAASVVYRAIRESRS